MDDAEKIAASIHRDPEYILEVVPDTVPTAPGVKAPSNDGADS